ncbi:Glutathione-dependent formaldehyde-activating family GFA [Macrophomina phaseolina MS6]|uniref:Glutathione-dependent formaldehyde-activating family GFA n=1 Tax=Macrophomina phaseolina (strain MS6) TaxID=1126212 RepID=K2REY2_MACPH|nr:Glutathione-dependent formaldehyde-activating family GFA [Macrophomina phaseolina MS6]
MSNANPSDPIEARLRVDGFRSFGTLKKSCEALCSCRFLCRGRLAGESSHRTGIYKSVEPAVLLLDSSSICCCLPTSTETNEIPSYLTTLNCNRQHDYLPRTLRLRPDQVGGHPREGPGQPHPLIIPKSALKFTAGGDNLKAYTYTGESGKPVHCYYCPNCTTHPYHHQTALGDDKIILRTGLLDESKSFKPAAEIFGKAKLSWEPEVAQTFETLPPS